MATRNSAINIYAAILVVPYKLMKTQIDACFMRMVCLCIGIGTGTGIGWRMAMGIEWEESLEVSGIEITMMRMKTRMGSRFVRDSLDGLSQGAINSQHGVEQCDSTKGDSFQPDTQPQLTRTDLLGAVFGGIHRVERKSRLFTKTFAIVDAGS
ncbi:hypothetical protein V3481_001746 [Fusarium oxysporum f. sp. vasinfectum]